MVSQNAINRSSDTLYVTTLDTNVAAAGVTLTATLSTDGTDANIPLVCNGKGTGPLQTTKIGIGVNATLDYEEFRIHGTSASFTAMPKMYITNSANAYPVWELSSYQHDNISMYFDCFFDGSSLKSSDAGSSFGLFKIGDTFLIKCNSGTAAGSAVSLTNAFVMQKTGEVTIPLQSAFLAYNSATDQDQTGDGTVVTVDFDTEVYDVNGDFAADTYTAPVTCKMNFQTTVCAGCGATAATGLYVKIVTSNRAYYGSGMQPTICRQGDGALFLTCACIADLDAADIAYVTLTGTAAVANDIDIVGNATPYSTFFSGAIIC